MVELKNIQKIYPNGFHALKNINLKVNEGEIYGIIGFSGAGKSTLIRIINLLETPSSGEVIVNGKDLRRLSPKDLRIERQKIGMIFQHFHLLTSKSVFENVAFALEIAKWEKSAIKSRVDELLALVGLSDKAHSYPSQLSGGQKQRVAIARALANHPHLLLCDEATSALDTKTTASILTLLRDIQTRLNLTIILITHQIDVVRSICDKMCVLSNGQIVESGRVGEIFINPQNEITRELIAFLPPTKDENLVELLDDRSDVYRVIFTGTKAHNPLISQMIREFGVDVNILSGNIDEVQSTEFGHLVVKILGNVAQKERAIVWLKSQGVEVQNLG
ncbi:methionine ABC transporter ATP-binding protein [Helicobacter sp. 23-1044]